MRDRRFWWIPLVTAGLDRFLKRLAARALSHGAVTAIPGILTWELTRNTGAAFSLLSGRNALLVVLTMALIVAIVIFQLRNDDLPRMARVGLWMIVGGGIGNLWDRVFCNGVIDFIRLDFMAFPIFNPADVFICIGAGLTLLSLLVFRRGGSPDA